MRGRASDGATCNRTTEWPGQHTEARARQAGRVAERVCGPVDAWGGDGDQPRPRSARMAAACRCASAWRSSSAASASSGGSTSRGCSVAPIGSRTRGLGTRAAYSIAFSRFDGAAGAGSAGAGGCCASTSRLITRRLREKSFTCARGGCHRRGARAASKRGARCAVDVGGPPHLLRVGALLEQLVGVQVGLHLAQRHVLRRHLARVRLVLRSSLAIASTSKSASPRMSGT